MRLAGTLPVPTQDSIYIFGQMDLGLNFNNSGNSSQLLLTPVPSSANLTYLNSSVISIPVSQPNRDRYRFGFGVDIFHLISSVKAKTAAAAAAKTTTPSQ